jgi:hypothetical protein
VPPPSLPLARTLRETGVPSGVETVSDSAEGREVGGTGRFLSAGE